jgi:nucleoside-diphosphate-sugar epimerase
MKALVTGATGFIGSHLTEALLKNGFSVSCLVRNNSNLRYIEGLNVSLLKGDCSDPESLKGIQGFDYVFHLAGLTKAADEQESYIANEKGTENIVNAVLRNNPKLKRFVYISSLAAAGPSPDGHPVSEDAQEKPVSVYGKTKLGGEQHVKGMKGKMPFTILRPSAIYGPRDGDLLVFFRMVKFGLIPYWGKSYYSFLYVDDLVNGIILSARRDEGEGEVFYMSDGEIYSSDDIIDSISVALQCRPLRLAVPKSAIPIIGVIAGRMKRGSVVNADKLRELRHSHWICSNKKAIENLGFAPRVKIREGAKWTSDWYRIHNWL